jgi:hypothetical protein
MTARREKLYKGIAAAVTLLVVAIMIRILIATK